MKSDISPNGGEKNSSHKWRNLAIAGIIMFLFFLIKGMLENPYRPN